MSACKGEDPRVHGIKSKIRVVPNFPKPGIMFQDITTLLLDPKAFKNTVDLFVERYKGEKISVVAGIEARGFIFGPPIALAIGAKFVPLRKPRKLPGEVISEEYVLEYGKDCLEMHIGAIEPGERALIVDDLIATGGTLCAAIKLLVLIRTFVLTWTCSNIYGTMGGCLKGVLTNLNQLFYTLVISSRVRALEAWCNLLFHLSIEAYTITFVLESPKWV
ncbi:Phosphoribosyltransferase domain [Macleaya cordata]|uniref:adenine phosphoribosyltransferase n=1 Tax=Macleaya cordata TaxID=56857 RepID=A0A200PT54_MACCD|nr:Phosphoribosyltransferase domain [Macleaya cordata]